MMRRRLVAAALAVLPVLPAACGEVSDTAGVDGQAVAADDATSAPAQTAPLTTAPVPVDAVALADLRINLIQFGDDGFVQILNDGETDASVAGIWLCRHTIHVDLGAVVAGARIPAGGTVRIPAGIVGGLAMQGGEAALYNADACTEPSTIFGFVQWGSGGPRHEAAAEAGIWPTGAYVTPDPEFGNIELFGDPADPESWS